MQMIEIACAVGAKKIDGEAAGLLNLAIGRNIHPKMLM